MSNVPIYKLTFNFYQIGDKMKQLSDFKEFQGKTSKKLDDLTGKKFNKLTVVKRGENICNHPAWICRCDCGNYTLVSSQNLRNNTTKSCGCWRKEMPTTRTLDISNQRFGKLIALEIDYKRTLNTPHGNGTYWKCKCDCGNIVSVPLQSLRRGHSNSCGCINSKGELKISQLLRDNNINFIKEKTFKNFVTPQKVYYRYDFYLPDYNRLIEYDGIQHFEEQIFFSQTLKEIQQTDKIKNQYAKNNNIELVRIPYTVLSNLSIDMLLGEQFRVI